MSSTSKYIKNNPQETQRLIGIGLKYEQLKQLLEKAIELRHQK